MAKNRDVKAIINDLDKDKKEEMLAGIRAMKLNYLLAILGLIGTIISFVVLQKTSIINFFRSEPILDVSMSGNYPKDTEVELSDNHAKQVVKTTLSQFPKNIQLQRGEYEIKILSDHQQIYSERLFLDYNEHRTMVLPDLFKGNLKLNVEARNKHPQIQDEIILDISSNGNGFLWIYEITGATCRLIYPAVEIRNTNKITADKIFEFPKDYGLIAGKSPGKERYCFLMTSVDREADANGAMHLLYPSYAIPKGDVTDTKKCWTSKEIELDVVAIIGQETARRL